MTVLKNAGAKSAAEKILNAFESGNLSKPMALSIIRKDDAPMNSWSYMNRFLCALAGCVDARGYKQWRKVGRQVKKGQKAATYILVPLTGKRKAVNEKGEEETVPFVYGFRGVPVFDITQTEGEAEVAEVEFFDSLPFVEVARKWGLDLFTYDGRNTNAAGTYRIGQHIRMGVEDTRVWLHELAHAADDRAGGLHRDRFHWSDEVVAELTSAVLSEMIGETVDTGGSWQYISHYAAESGIEPLTACRNVLGRVFSAIETILADVDEAVMA